MLLASTDFIVRQLGDLSSLYAHAVDHNLSVMPQAWLACLSVLSAPSLTSHHSACI